MYRPIKLLMHSLDRVGRVVFMSPSACLFANQIVCVCVSGESIVITDENAANVNSDGFAARCCKG